MQMAGCRIASAPSLRSCSASGSCGSAGRVIITRVPTSGRSAICEIFTSDSRLHHKASPIGQP